LCREEKWETMRFRGKSGGPSLSGTVQSLNWVEHVEPRSFAQFAGDGPETFSGFLERGLPG